VAGERGSFRGEVNDVDIGAPQRVIEIEPILLPVPEVLPEPSTTPASEPVPAPVAPVGSVAAR